MSLSLAQANTVIDVALRTARTLNTEPLTVVVLDAGGHLKAAQREDRSGILRFDIAFAKAWGALGMGQQSAHLAARAEKQSVFFSSLVQISHGRVALAAGGVLCTDDRGEIVGAVGISGDASDVDERCAVAGIESAGLRVLVSKATVGAAPKDSGPA